MYNTEHPDSFLEEFYLTPSDIVQLRGYGVTFIAYVEYDLVNGPNIKITKLSHSSNLLSSFESKNNVFSFYNELLRFQNSIIEKGNEKILIIRDDINRGHATITTFLLIGFQSTKEEILEIKYLFTQIMNNLRKTSLSLPEIIHDELNGLSTPEINFKNHTSVFSFLESPRIRHTLLLKKILGLILFDSKKKIIDIRALPPIVKDTTFKKEDIKDLIAFYMGKNLNEPVFHHSPQFTYFIIPPRDHRQSIWSFVIIDDTILNNTQDHLFSWLETLHNAINTTNISTLPQEHLRYAISFLVSNVNFEPTLHDEKFFAFLLQANNLVIEFLIPLDVLLLFCDFNDVTIPLEIILDVLKECTQESIAKAADSYDLPLTSVMIVIYKLYIKHAIQLFERS